ncbi:MAG: GNAT family N-acetyltransferase [Alphaproteobacteria bacterium]|nr:GNAT family N-acetyltransferase [Alphaproteobacteria bacterium]
MMQVAFQNSPREFLDKCGPYLERNEAEHNLILTLCQGAEQKLQRGEKVDIRFGVLSNEEGLVLVAAQTPPNNLVLSKASGPDIEKFAETLAEHQFSFPGIVGPSDVASVFSNKWTQLTGQKPVEYMDQIIYMLKKVTFPPPVEGKLRLARPEEAALIAEWFSAFTKDAMPKAEHVNSQDALKKSAEMIKAGRVVVWDVNGVPVAQAGISGTSTAARISMVYTPAEQRGRGYASAVVAHLSQMLLDQGKKMCCLYADARNPVSNSIYRKIGYEFVGRSSLYVLEKI